MSGKILKTPSADNIVASVNAAKKGRGLPPLHLWNPPFCGDLDIRIARDGTWFYLGTPIGRPALVKLFSSILKREKGKYFLVTPVEKVGIIVDDAPFVAVDFDQIDGDLHFTTHVGDKMIAGPKNPIRIERNELTGEPSPYILVRSELEALIDRKSFYRLVDIGIHKSLDGQSWFGLISKETFFPIIPSNDLET